MSLSKSRKRSYRYRVKCEEYEKEFDSDYVEAHSRIVHSGRNLSEMSLYQLIAIQRPTTKVIWFGKHDMYQLLDALDIPEYYISCQRTNAPGMEALMILLQKVCLPKQMV